MSGRSCTRYCWPSCGPRVCWTRTTRRHRRLPPPSPQGWAHTGPSPIDRARPGSKHHLIVHRHGTPLVVSLTSGNRHDVTQLMPLLDAIPHPRVARAAEAPAGPAVRRPRLRLRQVPPPSPDPRHHTEDRSQGHTSRLRPGQTRWVVERTFAWLHQFQRLRIRYEIRADLHLSLLQLACSIICLRRLRTSF
ncbi:MULTISPECIES: transposase [unclassified Streptomyces]|uniref:transposase n=1 Tax=unclassified Streptomyces TaxID=2593676 RepID=UPI0035A8EB35